MSAQQLQRCDMWGPTLLVVENDTVDATFQRFALEDLSPRPVVAVAPSCAAALGWLRSRALLGLPVDLVVVSAGVPDAACGIAALADALEGPAPIIILTDSAGPTPCRVPFAVAGASCVMDKREWFADVEAALATALASRMRLPHHTGGAPRHAAF